MAKRIRPEAKLKAYVIHYKGGLTCEILSGKPTWKPNKIVLVKPVGRVLDVATRLVMAKIIGELCTDAYGRGFERGEEAAKRDARTKEKRLRDRRVS